MFAAIKYWALLDSISLRYTAVRISPFKDEECTATPQIFDLELLSKKAKDIMKQIASKKHSYYACLTLTM